MESKELTFIQISLRGVIVFLVAIVMVRVADKRFLSKMTALDIILGFILASLLARAVNGSAPLFATLGGGFVLVFLHRALAWMAYRSHRFGQLVKGHADVLIQNGRIQEQNMSANKLTEHDLLEELRLRGRVGSPQEVKQAVLERSGDVSVIPAEKKG